MRTALLSLLTLMLLVACSDDERPNLVVGELASDRIELTAESSEPIVEIAVAEGEQVSAGQLLLRQDTARATARLEQADAALRQAQARLDELVRGPRSERISAARASVHGAEQDLEFREAEFERARLVHAKGLASPELLDQADAALDAARSNLDLQRAQLTELLAGTTAEELALAEQAVKQAEAVRDAARVDVDRHDIRAPVDGTADTRLFELGERPAPGQVVIVLLPGEQVHARVYVPEALRARVGPGTNARIFVDGLPDAIAGRVRWVSSEAAFTPYFALTEHDRGRLSFLAKVDIAEDRPRLPDGLPAQVEFELE